ncbi:MAG TPA: sigma 54-interacting transcriptional regulator [Candidatus Krumholzibacteria bacterium]|nr:sigma 54-interacting transcriptional regulator [Candidatus Krumholzibacteria bacterium]HPD72868.1 sigma 54-interacting transcriptional regulator [Candidatus Krumholzibacteria bacterium]HRY41667.1 sigma 54-interacting transcriptional regulator [Candidatus Krumholzibacteria bacterium]
MDARGRSLAGKAAPAPVAGPRCAIAPHAVSPCDRPVPRNLLVAALHAILHERYVEGGALVAAILADHAELPPSFAARRAAPGDGNLPAGVLDEPGAAELIRDPARPRVGDAAVLASRVLYRRQFFAELAVWVDEVRRRDLVWSDEPLPELEYGAALIRAGRLREGRALLEQVERDHPGIPPLRRAMLANNLGVAVSQMGEFQRARDLLAEAVAICRAPRHEWLLGSMLTGHALLELRSFSLDHAEALLREAVERLDGTRQRLRAHQARFNLAIAHYKQGRLAEALAQVDCCEDQLRRGGDLQCWIMARLTRCKIHLVAGQADEADAIACEVERLDAARTFQRELGLAIEMQGDAAVLRGQLAAARARYERALAMARVETPDGDLAAGLKRRLAQVALLSGEFAAAHRGLMEALLASCTAGEMFEEVVSGRLLAVTRRRLGDLDGARSAARTAVERARIHGCQIELARSLLEEARAEARLAASGRAASRETAWARAAEARQVAVRLGFAADHAEIDRFLSRLREAWRAAWVWAGGPPPPESLDDRATPAFVAGSPPMVAAAAEMAAAAAVDDPVLITGETGTGKEVAARRIHDLGRRREHPLIAVNCAAVPADLFEREFFGHAAGAFTGADHDAPGLVELAHRGTLFLDEVGDVPADLQAKLLRLLQDGTFRRLGDPGERSVDLRVIAATNVDLPARIAAGDFRPDLYYRLNVLQVSLPPLRVRGPDVRELVRVFVRRALGADAEPEAAVPAAVLAAIDRYGWPGNVRELEALVRRACLFARSGRMLPPGMVPAGLRAVMAVEDGASATAGDHGDDEGEDEGGGEDCGGRDRSDGRCGRSTSSGAPTTSPESAADLSLDARLVDAERTAIRDALAAALGNRTLAAKLLGVSRKSLYDRLRRLGIAG